MYRRLSGLLRRRFARHEVRPKSCVAQISRRLDNLWYITFKSLKKNKTQ